MNAEPPKSPRHTKLEDALALCVGVLLIALAVSFYQHAGLLTGGVAGLSFLTQYATGLPFGLPFFVINLPFYWLAYRRMGRALLVKTVIAVTLISLLTSLMPSVLTLGAVAPLYAAVIGGVLMGTGFLVLFRHRITLGGFGILVLYLQDRFGISAGKVQMAIDCTIVVAALFVLPPDRVLLSVAGALLLNILLAVNHRADRYLGT